MLGNDNNSTSPSIDPHDQPFTTSSSVDIGSTSSNAKRKRRPAGTPDPDAEVVSLSPKTLLESDRYVCEICNQGFQRDQNLQMHRRRHKVPWKLLKRENPVVKKRVFVCPEPTCLHHDPCHALGDLVGIKKHFRRKHSNHKQWVCDKCSKAYAVQSDYKAHLKTCGTRGHSCDCGRVFSRVESFIEHQDACSIGRLRPTDSHSNIQLHPTVCLSRTASSPSPSSETNLSTTPWTTTSTTTTTGLVLPKPRPMDHIIHHNNNYNNYMVSNNQLHILRSCSTPTTNNNYNNNMNYNHMNKALDMADGNGSGSPSPSKMMDMMIRRTKKRNGIQQHQQQQQQQCHNTGLELQLLTMNNSRDQDEDPVAISDENHSTTQLQLSIGSSMDPVIVSDNHSNNIGNSDKKLDHHHHHDSSTTTTTTTHVLPAVNNCSKNPAPSSSLMASLKDEASEQLKLAMAEKDYAEEVRKEAKRRTDIAEREFAKARQIRQQAQAELEKAHQLKNHAMKQITSTLLQITCQACKRQFEAADGDHHEPNSSSFPLNYNIMDSGSPTAADMSTDEEDHDQDRMKNIRPC